MKNVTKLTIHYDDGTTADFKDDFIVACTDFSKTDDKDREDSAVAFAGNPPTIMTLLVFLIVRFINASNLSKYAFFMTIQEGVNKFSDAITDYDFKKVMDDINKQ